MAKIIAIASGKGGVGKTITSINIAAALNMLGKNAVVIDGNLTGANISLYLGSPVVPVTLNHVLQGKKHIYEAVYEHHSGLKVVPSSISIETLKNIKAEKFKKEMQKLKKIAEFIILDSAAGIGDEAMLALNALNEDDDLIVVTAPEMPSITDTIKTIKMAEKFKKNVKGIIITRVRNDKKEISSKNIKELMEKPILAKVPEDDAVRESVMMKNAVVLTHPNGKAAKSYKRLASKIANMEYDEEKGFFKRLLDRIFSA